MFSLKNISIKYYYKVDYGVLKEACVQQKVQVGIEDSDQSAQSDQSSIITLWVAKVSTFIQADTKTHI